MMKNETLKIVEMFISATLEIRNKIFISKSFKYLRKQKLFFKAKKIPLTYENAETT